MSGVYYNEWDPEIAAWLRELIRQGELPDGEVDERDIRDIRADDLRGFHQIHLFAGIGGWALALDRAGYPPNRPALTFSCPCQPFSNAGKKKGFDDERHLWPHVDVLIRELEPPTCYFEQVATKDGLAWLDLVSADMEAKNYAVAPLDICAAGFGSPNIRQRLYGYARRLVDRFGKRLEGLAWDGDGTPGRTIEGRPVAASSSTRRMARADGRNARAEREQRSGQHGLIPANSLLRERDRRPGPVNGFWDDADWLRCRDERWRPVEPGTFPLADGVPYRMVKLRGYGNGLNIEAATAFVEATLEAEGLIVDAAGPVSDDLEDLI